MQNNAASDSDVVEWLPCITSVFQQRYISSPDANLIITLNSRCHHMMCYNISMA